MCKYFYSINFVICTMQYILRSRNIAMLHYYMVQILLHICKRTYSQLVRWLNSIMYFLHS